MKLVNLTPHPLVIQRECKQCAGTGLRDAGEPALGPCPSCQDGYESITVESSGVARCAITEEVIGDVDGIPITKSTYGEVEGLPGQSYDSVYVVSSITAQAVPHRTDVFVPARPVRDEQGRIVACRALGRPDNMKTPTMEDLVGRTFGRLTVEHFAHLDTQGHSYWVCRCACGTTCVRRGSKLRSGRTVSCGCQRADVGRTARKNGRMAQEVTR